MSIADTVSVTVSVQDVLPAIANFGEPLILAYHTNFFGVREYEASPAGLTALVTDGFSVSHAVYRKAAAIVAQNPHTDKFKVGRRANPNKQEIKLTPQWATVGKPLSVDVTVGTTTTTVTHTPAGGATIATVCTSISAAILAIVGAVAVDVTTHVLCHPSNLAERIYLSNIVGLTVEDTSGDAKGGQALHITPSAPGGAVVVYALTVSVGDAVTPITFSSDTEDTQETVCTHLEALIEAVDGITSSVVVGAGDTDYILVTGDSITAPVYVSGVSVTLTVLDSSPAAGIALDLADAAAADNDWFGLLIDSNSPAEIAAAGAWALANERILGVLSVDSDNFVVSDGVAYALKTATNTNTYVLATRDQLGCGEAGLMGRQLSRTPGGTTWAHKQIAGATADGLSATEFAAARANGAIVYVNDGVVHTYDGWACSGRYLDVTQGIAWLRARIREAVLIVLVNAEKLGFTNADAATIDAAVAGVLSQGESNKLLMPGWAVTRPDVAAVSAANKLGRIFPDLKFKAVLQGAIQKVIIDGTLTV
jgi:hypothetical protein